MQRTPSTGRALAVQADAMRLALPDACVDLICTSPPYYRLRQYAVQGAIGLEDSPQEYLEALWTATAEMARVLKPGGSIFVDLGDKYAERGGPERDAGADGGQVTYRAARPRRQGEQETGIRQKSLMLLPERYRIGCVDRLGLIARAVVCWSKVNGLPESVNDRVRRSHEDIVHLTKAPRYYAALDELRTPLAAKTLTHRGGGQAWGQDSNPDNNWAGNGKVREANPLGALPGSVWPIPSDPLKLPDYLVRDSNGSWMGDGAALWQHAARHGPGVILEPLEHYAAYPPALVRRIVLGWSPPGICVACGQGRWPVVDKRQEVTQHSRTSTYKAPENGRSEYFNDRTRSEATILGYACSCTPFTDHPGTGGRERNGQAYAIETGRDAHPHGGVGMLPRTGPWREHHLDGWRAPPTRPAIVLDPFSGVGTTILVSRALGRIGIGTDLSHAYSRAAQWRAHHSGEWQQVIERTTGRRVHPLPKHDPAQERLL
jgi:hypothetical protein